MLSLHFYINLSFYPPERPELSKYFYFPKYKTDQKYFCKHSKVLGCLVLQFWWQNTQGQQIWIEDGMLKTGLIWSIIANKVV